MDEIQVILVMMISVMCSISVHAIISLWMRSKKPGPGHHQRVEDNHQKVDKNRQRVESTKREDQGREFPTIPSVDGVIVIDNMKRIPRRRAMEDAPRKPLTLRFSLSKARADISELESEVSAGASLEDISRRSVGFFVSDANQDGMEVHCDEACQECLLSGCVRSRRSHRAHYCANCIIHHSTNCWMADYDSYSDCCSMINEDV